MFLLTFGRCGKAEWRQNAATDALLTFGRWGDIAGKMHTLGRWGILFSLGMSVRVVFCSGAAVGGSWETFFERKTGFELALISLPLGSKSARVGPAPFYILPGPPQEGGEGLGASPVSRSGAGGSIKKDRGGGAAVGGSWETLLSGKRGSNPRPSAWEADALPAELFPRKIFTFARFGTAKI